MQVILFSSQLGHGKDMAADYLAKSLNKTSEENISWLNKTISEKISEDGEDYSIESDYKDLAKNQRLLWERAAFAGAVKSVYETSFGVNREFIEAWKRNPECPPGMDMNVRQSLQFIGDGFRKIKANIWIEIALRNEYKKLILSDGRYINEAKAVKEKGGINIVVYRPGYLNNDLNLSEAQIRPILEFCAENFKDGSIRKQIFDKTFDQKPDGIQNYDFFLINDGSLEDLYAKIDKLLIPFIKEKYGLK